MAVVWGVQHAHRHSPGLEWWPEGLVPSKGVPEGRLQKGGRGWDGERPRQGWWEARVAALLRGPAPTPGPPQGQDARFRICGGVRGAGWVRGGPKSSTSVAASVFCTLTRVGARTGLSLAGFHGAPSCRLSLPLDCLWGPLRPAVPPSASRASPASHGHFGSLNPLAGAWEPALRSREFGEKPGWRANPFTVAAETDSSAFDSRRKHVILGCPHVRGSGL